MPGTAASAFATSRPMSASKVPACTIISPTMESLAAAVARRYTERFLATVEQEIATGAELDRGLD